MAKEQKFTEDGRKIIHRTEQFHNLTINQIVDWAIERQLDPDVIKLSGGHFTWESPQTDREYEQWKAWDDQSTRRREKYEKEQWERLSQVYGTEKSESVTPYIGPIY